MMEKYWSAKEGLFLDAPNGKPVVVEPQLHWENNSDIIRHYFCYLQNARKKDGTYDFSKSNARELVWDLGNKVKLSKIRNMISNFSKDNGMKFKTLSSRAVETAVDKKQKSQDLYGVLTGVLDMESMKI